MRTCVVYIHWHGETPIYVGVGTHKRAKDRHNRSKLWLDHVEQHGLPEVDLYEGLTQEAAWACEQLLIEQYKRTVDGGTLLQYSTGGRGGSTGMVVSAETRAKIGDAFRGKKKPPTSPEHSANISAGKRGKPWTAARWEAQAAKRVAA
jgi:hypothetical protein